MRRARRSASSVAGPMSRNPASRGSHRHGKLPCTAKRVAGNVPNRCAAPGASPLSTLLTDRLRPPRGRRLFRITGLPHWTRNKHAART
jgi:hypothetical protein